MVKIYYTSSYKGAGADINESHPDFIEDTWPLTLYNTIVTSNAGARGVIWKKNPVMVLLFINH